MIESLLHIIPKHLIEGRIVRLGDSGSFGVRLPSDGSETEEAFTKSLLHRLKLYFRPGSEVKKTLDGAAIQKA